MRCSSPLPIPILAILLGVVVLGEALLPKHLAGMTLIALGLAAMDGRPLRMAFARMVAQRGRVP